MNVKIFKIKISKDEELKFKASLSALALLNYKSLIGNDFMEDLASFLQKIMVIDNDTEKQKLEAFGKIDMLFILNVLYSGAKAYNVNFMERNDFLKKIPISFMNDSDFITEFTKWLTESIGGENGLKDQSPSG